MTTRTVNSPSKSLTFTAVRQFGTPTSQRSILLLLTAATLLRLTLFFFSPSIPHYLSERVELTTPITSFKRLQEGLFLYHHSDGPPLSFGGICHHSPLLIKLFSLLPDFYTNPFPSDLVFVATDFISAVYLMRIGQTQASTHSKYFQSTRSSNQWSTLTIGACYLFNPFTILTCLARSTSSFTNCFILISVYNAIKGNWVKLVVSLSLATCLSLYPVLLAFPLFYLCYDNLSYWPKSPDSLHSAPRESPKRQLTRSSYSPSHPFKFFVIQVVIFTLCTCMLQLVSYTVSGSWEYLAGTYGFHFLVPDLTPNVGLWWYFFTEIFDSFRHFFLSIFWLHLLSYVVGFTLRLRRQLLFAVVALTGIFAIFLPYPSLGDASLFFACLSLYSHVFPLMRCPFISTGILLYAIFLGPVCYHLWIFSGAGNANFFYAITLVWNLGLTLFLGDALYATLLDEFHTDNPESRDRKLRLV